MAALAAVAIAGCSGESTSQAGTSPAGTTGVSSPAGTGVATTAPATTAPVTTGPVTTGPVTAPEPAPDTVEALLELDRPVVLAHAGGEQDHPHSTPYAYAMSVAAGVDVLDLDVRLSGDGVLIVHHDDTVDRTTATTGPVDGLTYEQLAVLDNAHWFSAECTCTGQADDAYVLRGVRTGEVPPPPGYVPADFAIPRFRDIVERHPDALLNIEIKGTGAPAVAAAEVLAAELTELGRLDAAVVTSFDDTVVDAFAALAPTVELTPGLGASSAWVLDRTPLPAGMRILQLPMAYEGLEVITPELIADSHAAGYVIWVWPNDDAWESFDAYTALIDMGLDGLNINRPAAGVAAVAAA